MRTTVTLADDVAAAVAARRQQTGAGLSEALNDLVRAGLRDAPDRPAFRQRRVTLGLRLDVSNVGHALETIEGPRHR